MPEPARHLRVIDSQGEVQDDCPQCQALRDQLAGAETEIRGWRQRYQNLKRDKDADAQKDALWPTAVELFALWRRDTGHKRSLWTLDRFEKVRPLLEKYGRSACELAIRGIAYEPNTKMRKNGTMERFDDWGLVFRDAGTLERYANRAPKA